MGSRWESALVPRLHDRIAVAETLLPIVAMCEPRRTVMVHFFGAAPNTVGSSLESVELLFGRKGKMRVLPEHQRFGSTDSSPLVAERLAASLGEAVYVRYVDTSNSFSVVSLRGEEANQITGDSAVFGKALQAVGLPFTSVDDLFDTFYSSESPVWSFYLRREGVTMRRPQPAG